MVGRSAVDGPCRVDARREGHGAQGNCVRRARTPRPGDDATLAAMNPSATIAAGATQAPSSTASRPARSLQRSCRLQRSIQTTASRFCRTLAVALSRAWETSTSGSSASATAPASPSALPFHFARYRDGRAWPSASGVPGLGLLAMTAHLLTSPIVSVQASSPFSPPRRFCTSRGAHPAGPPLCTTIAIAAHACESRLPFSHQRGARPHRVFSPLVTPLAQRPPAPLWFRRGQCALASP